MSPLDVATLLSLMAANPVDRQATVQRMLLDHMSGDAAAAAPAASVLAPDRPTGAPDALRGLYREAEHLHAELRRVGGLLGRTARALGACERCLGTEEACERCAGTAPPGTEVPEMAEFDVLVAPALRRLSEELDAVATTSTEEEQDG